MREEIPFQEGKVLDPRWLNKDLIRALKEWLEVRGEYDADAVFIAQNVDHSQGKGLGIFSKS